MLIFTKIPELQAFLRERKAASATVGFVPTMGALHPGHLSLIAASRYSTNLTVCSIFVNPTQFNNQDDLKRYPRMPEKDSMLLREAGCDVLFLPSVDEIYPDKGPVSFDLGYPGTVLEAAHRPGHFNGVAQVVKRLFEIVQPDKAFFGTKDYQQVMVVRELVKRLGMSVEIVPCPAMREPDGLAMSSRNTLLTPEERKVAGLVPVLLAKARDIALSKGFKEAKQYVQHQVAQQPLMKLDYYEICEADTLHVAGEAPNGKKIISLIAVYVGKVRLIDNLFVN